MKTNLLRCGLILAAAVIQLQTAMAFSNEPVESIDLKRFDGKWYSLTSIPTMMDKDWLETNRILHAAGGLVLRRADDVSEGGQDGVEGNQFPVVPGRGRGGGDEGAVFVAIQSGVSGDRVGG